MTLKAILKSSLKELRAITRVNPLLAYFLIIDKDFHTQNRIKVGQLSLLMKRDKYSFC